MPPPHQRSTCLKVEILPGVLVNYGVDGLVNLGVPMGTPAYVQYKEMQHLGHGGVG